MTVASRSTKECSAVWTVAPLSVRENVIKLTHTWTKCTLVAEFAGGITLLVLICLWRARGRRGTALNAEVASGANSVFILASVTPCWTIVTRRTWILYPETSFD
jgi:hypothetical protein